MQKTVHIDGYKFCRDEKTGYYLSSKKIDGKRKRLHVYVWEKNNGSIPPRFHIHHIDKNKSNNSIENLELIQSSSHLSIHGKDNVEQKRLNFIEYAHPAAKLWHGSEAGLAWHKEHGHIVASKTYSEKSAPLVCKNCGEEFLTYEILAHRHEFCSDKCKSAFRRQSGVDNEERECLFCGSKFTVNKYKEVRCCSRSCSAKQRWIEKRENKIN